MSMRNQPQKVTKNRIVNDGHEQLEVYVTVDGQVLLFENSILIVTMEADYADELADDLSAGAELAYSVEA